MLKKKKSSNIQNHGYQKRSQITVPSNYNTQQIRIATLSSIDTKAFNKTIQSKKSSLNNTKKSISRKSTLQNSKNNTCLQSPNISRLFKEFNELKLIHQNSSKSPGSCKSKSTKKNKPKKLSSQTLRISSQTFKNKAIKLQKKLKQLQINDIFNEQLSSLAFPSDDATSLKQHLISFQSSTDDTINLIEIRDFCSTAKLIHQKQYPVNTKYNEQFKQNQAALKIQRAWKRYRTKKLIERYVFMIKSRLSHRIENEGIQNQSWLFSNIHQYQDNFEHQSKISSINDKDNSSNNEKDNYVQVIKNMKIQQTYKWDQLIKIIKQTKCSNHNEIQQLFQTITHKSEANKQYLLNNQKADIDESQRIVSQNSQIVQHIKPPQKMQIFPYQSRSQISIQQTEQYNSRKYVNFLDCDMYSHQKSNASESSQKKLQKALKKSTISKKKQEMLLNLLQDSILPIRLGQNQLYNSNSQTSLTNKSFKDSQQESKGSNFSISRNNLIRVNSEKIVRHSLKKSQQEDNNYQQLFIIQSIQHQKQKNLIKEELMKLSDHKQQKNIQDGQVNQFFTEFSRENIQQDDNQEDKQFKRSKFSDQLSIQQTKNQNLSFFKIHSVETDQHYQQNKNSPIDIQTIQNENYFEQQAEKQKKIQQISILIFNNLILESLKDIAKSDALSKSFKNYSRQIKSKNKKSAKRKGFPTDKKQIESFLDNIISYLKTHEPKVFKNLEVPTGPSAIQMLKYMHQSSRQEQISLCDDEDQANIMVIPNRIFDLFWGLKEKSIVVQLPNNIIDIHFASLKQNLDYLKSFNKIFYRSLFDTLNQCLDYSRNFGQYGRPFPWKKTPKFIHIFSDPKIQSGINLARKKMMQLATTYCGLIVQKEQVNDIGESEQYITQVQEDRLSRMLASDLIDNESKWLFYDDEEAQILIELSEQIYDEILYQTCLDLRKYF